MTKKEIGRVIGFALLVCVLILGLNDLFEQENTKNFDRRFTTYRSFEEDSIDVVWVGTSGVDRYWIASQAYEEYGMTVYPLSVNEMPSWLFTNVIEEAYKYQNPKLIIVDTRAFGQDNTDEGRADTRARRVMDAMKYLSVNRFKTALKTMKIMSSTFEDYNKTDLSYLLPYIKYHSKWAEEDYTIEKNWGNQEHQYLGFNMDKNLTGTIVEQEIVEYDPELLVPLDPVAEESLYELLEYVEEKDIQVLFVDTPHIKNETEMGRANTVYQILDEHNVPYLNFCDTNDEGRFVGVEDIDPQTDFYNSGHANLYGAQKFTVVMAAYLDANYDLPDRRNDADIQKDWTGIYEKIQKKVDKWVEENNE